MNETIKFQRDISDKWKNFKIVAKFWLIVSLIIFLIISIIFRWITIQIVFETDYKSNLLYTIGNALVFGVYWSVVGLFNKGFRNNILRYLLAMILITVAFTGLGFVDFKFSFNYVIFNSVHNTYSTGGSESFNLFLFNLHIFIPIIVVSIFLMYEKKS